MNITLYSILLYPLFYLICLIIGEYVFPTRNGAMLCAFPAAFICSFVYAKLRSITVAKRKRKSTAKAHREKIIMQAQLCEKEKFAVYFPEGAITDNSAHGLDDENLLEILRKNHRSTDIWSLNGITDSGKKLLNKLNIAYTEHTQDEIIQRLENANLPEIKIIDSEPRLKRLKSIFTSRTFARTGLKSGISLLLLSPVALYGKYYIISGIVLTVYSVIILIKSKKRQSTKSNSMPSI